MSAPPATAGAGLREVGRKRNEARVLGSRRVRDFVCARSSAGRRIKIYGDGWLLADGAWMGQIQPRRIATAGRNGGLLVGLWTTGPSGQAEKVAGRNSTTV
jgi:hypothetical protein